MISDAKLTKKALAIAKRLESSHSLPVTFDHSRLNRSTSGFIIDDAIDYKCYMKYNMDPFLTIQAYQK